MTTLHPESNAPDNGEQYLSKESREALIGDIRTEIDGLVGSIPAKYHISNEGMEKGKYDIYKTPMDSFVFDAAKYVDKETGATTYETSALRAGGPTHDLDRYSEVIRLHDDGRIQLVIIHEKTGVSINSDEDNEFQDAWLKRMQKMLADRKAGIEKSEHARQQIKTSEAHPDVQLKHPGFGERALRLLGLKRQ